MSKMANNRDNRPTDPENLTEFLLKADQARTKEGNKLEKKTDQARTEHSENKATVTNGPANAIRMIFVPLWLYKLVLRTAFARTFVTVAIKCGGKNQHFLRTLLGGRGGGLEKCMVCTLVKMLIIVNDP